MTETDPLARFDRSAAAATAVIANIKSDQFDLPTPCSDWNVRQLLNHLVGGTRLFISLSTGGPPVDRTADFLGDDPAQAFRDSVAGLRATFTGEGALERPVQTPFGERPARTLLEMRMVEMMIHGWDAARATGQSTDLDPALAQECIESLERLQASGRGGGMFHEPQQAPPGATTADRLAAMAGRRVA
jgi:uncharacterized protein (TIGR03086 family)